MSKKGLFVVKSPKGKVVKAVDMNLDVNTFDNKMRAKKARDVLNFDNGFTAEMVHVGDGYTISRGPGHWRNMP